MGKRKSKTKPNDENNPIDLTSVTAPLDPETYGVLISNHRTCWLHTIAHFHARKMKMKAEKIKALQLTCPCFIGSFPQRERSKRGVSHKNAISNQNLDTFPQRERSKRSVSHKNAISNQNLDTFPQRERLKRGVSHKKNAISNQKKKLDSGAFQCYLENLWRSFSDDKMASFTYLDCLWFFLYMKASSRPKVLEWIKRKHIFSKKYVFVPIVIWSHWSLLIFCHFGESSQSKTRTPCMLLLDSLEMAGPRRLEPDIRKFVLDIYRAEGRPETKDIISQIPLLVPKVPQQRDDEECGRFVLYFINLFVEGAPENFSTDPDKYPYFMKKDWFSKEGLECFCERLDSFGSDSNSFA